MRATLLTAVRAVVRADSDPIRQALFSALRQRNARVRAASWLHERLGRSETSSLLVAAYGIKSWLAMCPGRNERARLIAIAVHANAQRRVADVARAFGEQHVDHIRTGGLVLLHPSNVLLLSRVVTRMHSMRKSFRLIHAINGRHDFLVSCRVASVLGCYARSKSLLASSRPEGVLVSSDSNPEEIGLVAAARSLSIPTIFVSHAYTTSVSPPLNFSLSILEGEAAVDAHSRKGAVTGTIFLGGVGGVSKPMQPSRLERPAPVIGIFAPKAIEWSVFSTVVDDCREHFGARQIVIRWHPSMIEHPRLIDVLKDVSGVTETPSVAAILDVANQCDWVIADAASNVHLQVLKLGIPTISVARIGVLKENQTDLYGFVANRVVFPPIPSLRELSVREAVAFYSGEWATRFRRYDANYLQSDHSMNIRLTEAIRNVLGERQLCHPSAG